LCGVKFFQLWGRSKPFVPQEQIRNGRSQIKQHGNWTLETEQVSHRFKKNRGA